MNIVNNDVNFGSLGSLIGITGIIATLFKELGIIQFVDSLIPKERKHKVTHGEYFLALLLVSFSLESRALYSVSEQLRKLPLQLLFGRDISYLDFNDDVLGKFLEAIFNFGTKAFFWRFTSHIQQQLPDLYDMSKLHGDTTNFGVHGKYEQEPEAPFKITYGHPKDGRNRLKLFTLFLLTDANGIPLLMKELSGNASDSKELGSNMIQAMDKLKQNIDFEKEPYCIADAAFYNKNNIQNFNGLFISRVPETIKEANNLVASEIEMTQVEDQEGYRFYTTSSSYGDVEQK
ncbi:MAG: IS1634 family transposase, partial [Deltaproteobacteria bacterium]|nr:IS1634 family transposase [Deltaproteobacteria bacterium]